MRRAENKEIFLRQQTNKKKKNQENQEPGPLTMIYSEELLTQSQRQSGMSIAHGT